MLRSPNSGKLGVPLIFPLIALLFACAMNAYGATIPQNRLDFDHLATGYLLTGLHEFIPCESCHVKGVFEGTPKTCYGCHNGMIALGKSAGHIPTTASCDACHSSTLNFQMTALMDHSTVIQPCVTCHNGTTATGKKVGHIASSNRCDACHSTLSFARVPRVDHAEVLGRCATCHNKSPTHIYSSDNCAACHSPTLKFKEVPRVDHAEVIGSCASCHVKSADHILSTNSCETCHSTAAFKPALR